MTRLHGLRVSPTPARGAARCEQGGGELISGGREILLPACYLLARNCDRTASRGDSMDKALILKWKIWYSWVGSNHRPPVPQTGALTN